MAALSAAQFVIDTDKLVAAFVAFKGTVGSGYGTGDSAAAIGDDWGLSRKLRDLEQIIFAYSDYDLSSPLLQPVHTALSQSAGYQQLFPRIVNPILLGLATLCRQAGLTGVSSIESFAAYYNTGAGGPWATLLAPNRRDVYYLWKGVYPSPLNVYSPAITNMATRAIASSTPGSYADGTAVDTTKYAGAAVLNATVTGHSGSSGTLTVTANGYNSSGAAVTAHTWTATVAGSAVVALAPSAAGDIATDITAIAFPGGMTDGTVVISAAPPAGRTNPPT